MTSNPTLRIGLIGTGRIGQVHAASVAALPGVSLDWVADPFIDGATRTAEAYGVPNVTADPLEVISSGSVDGVIIAAPTPTHVGLIEASIDAGVPVLCEKPIDLDIARVDALRAKAEATSTPVQIGFNRRFDPHFAELRRRVAAGEIGALEQLAITSRDPEPPAAEYVAVSGGIFRDMTIHDFDMARFFVPDIVEVTARGARQFDSAIAAAGDYDAVVVTLRGANDELITITNSRHSSYGYEGLAPYRNFFLERYADAYRLELEAFAEWIRGGMANAPGFDDGRAALVLADAAVRSAAEGVSVAVDLRA
jgi:myo-inositol 2-dehydrogenase/D-chiro-inositol 1-dehydrogenase